MPRIIFKNDKQSQFLQEVRQFSGLNIDKLALLCNVAPRTFRDWLRGKYTISEDALFSLKNKLKIKLPEDIEVVDDYWYVVKGARKGALKRMQLYGPPGTPEGRSKGGLVSQTRRRKNPKKYKLLGCNIKKNFEISGSSIEFAEVVGVILGDGCITDNQVRVTLSSLVDREYALFVVDLFQRVFNEKPSLIARKTEHVLDIEISGVGLVEKLEQYGFVRGNKVKNQVDFPKWIWQNIEFQKACVRGLMDTDGGCYFHKHKVNGLIYRNFGMCFTSHSLPLVKSMAQVLKLLGLKFYVVNKETQIYIYSFVEIKKYFNLVGSHNAKNIEKFNSYLNESSYRLLKAH